MNLQFIKATVCPTCLAETVAEEINGHHCNGQDFEVRKFKCGCKLAWVPNFERLEMQEKCPHSVDVVAKKFHRTQLIQNIIALIDKSEADEEFRKYVKSSVSYLR